LHSAGKFAPFKRTQSNIQRLALRVGNLAENSRRRPRSDYGHADRRGVADREWGKRRQPEDLRVIDLTSKMAAQRRGRRLVYTVLPMLLCALQAWSCAEDVRAADDGLIAVDTALVLAVDVSDSVDADRYRMQMEGIALALEDDGVIHAITSGPRGAILLSLVSWSDRAEVSMPWRVIASREDAEAAARVVRRLPQLKGEFTCLTRMLEQVREGVIADIPGTATRVVIDVSGDGIDNCADGAEAMAARDRLVDLGVTINGLPIIVKGENEVVGAGAYRAPGFGLREGGPGTTETTLDSWYAAHVVGGAQGFLLKADGFEDFGRAFRQKFVTEISVLADVP
jgi:hypothetical protein